MARKRGNPLREVPVEDYEHKAATRPNNPPVGLAHLDREQTPTKTLSYDPHLDPQLVWAGKAERDTVEIPAPSIHVHEELSAEAIIGSVRRQRLQLPLFDVDALEPGQEVEFYQHDLGWTNRMILGDSLVVMSSLLERERMAGKVQCVFMDPPYGVKYNSNFQPSISSRAVQDGQDESLTREPEMVQAYRDTWELGVHSYLTYLRDRISLARDLLTPSGSIFVQIGEENVHLVRTVLDEVFGSHNRVAQITFQKTANSTGRNLPIVTDYLLWFARDIEQVKYRPLFKPREFGDASAHAYTRLRTSEGEDRTLTRAERAGVEALPPDAKVYRLAPLTSQSIGRRKGPGEASWFEVEVDGEAYTPGPTARWKTNETGMQRLLAAGRVKASGNTLNYVRYLDDFDGVALTNVWTDTAMSGSADQKRYVVQTNPKVIARCMAMTTDPGDLILDPTCGGGTTAFVAEQQGRRWVTCDTSRVALAVARERLLTAMYPYYRLQDEARGVDGGFLYRTSTRISLGQIAKGERPEEVVFYDHPLEDRTKARVSGPFTVEALSRYAVNPSDGNPSQSQTVEQDATDHVEILLSALKTQGIPRPGKKPATIESLTPINAAGSLQAEGIADLEGEKVRFAVALGPKFGAVTMGQVSDALRESIGFGLIVFAGFAVSADAQERIATGRIGGTPVSLLLANPDLLVGDLLKNTKASQTFRLYSAPDVRLDKGEDGYRVTVEGVDSYDAATGEVISYGKGGVQAWFLDTDYDGMVFRVSQAFFPVTDAWKKLQRALRGTVDEELVEELHGWTSLPFEPGEHGRVAIRVIAQDGNASEVVRTLGAA